MQFFAKNTEKGLIPLYPEDLDEKKKLKLGEMVKCERWKERNIKFHKKFFALLKIGLENTKTFTEPIPFNAYRAWAVMKAGYHELYKTNRGLMVLPKSISFKSMDEDEFQELYSAVLDVIIRDTGADKQFIEEQLIDFL